MSVTEPTREDLLAEVRRLEDRCAELERRGEKMKDEVVECLAEAANEMRTAVRERFLHSVIGYTGELASLRRADGWRRRSRIWSSSRRVGPTRKAAR